MYADLIPSAILGILVLGEPGHLAEGTNKTPSIPPTTSIILYGNHSAGAC